MSDECQPNDSFPKSANEHFSRKNGFLKHDAVHVSRILRNAKHGVIHVSRIRHDVLFLTFLTALLGIL
jgi:hypothetical protein